MLKNEGWNILNKTKTGSIGGNTIKWTKEKCLDELTKYKDIDILKKNNITVFRKLKNNNWL